MVSIGPGQETKLMQNCGKSTFKRTSIDRLMNVLVLCVSLQIILGFSNYPIKKLWYSLWVVMETISFETDSSCQSRTYDLAYMAS